MPFHRSSARYSETPVPETPYQAAQQLWDDRIGSARVQAMNWRLMAFGALALSLLTAGGLVWESTRSTVTPYVVEVDRQGSIRAVGPATENFRPADRHIIRELTQFVVNVRSLSLDPIVVRNSWNTAYQYVTQRAALMLNEYARERDPFSKIGRNSITADVTSAVRMSDTSFQLRWIERTYTNGSLSTVEHWTAILSIVLRPPKEEEQILKNPLGIYVDGLNWSREIGNDTGDKK